MAPVKGPIRILQEMLQLGQNINISWAAKALNVHHHTIEHPPPWEN